MANWLLSLYNYTPHFPCTRFLRRGPPLLLYHIFPYLSKAGKLENFGKLEQAGRLEEYGDWEESKLEDPHYIFLSKLEQILLFGNFWKAGTFI